MARVLRDRRVLVVALALVGILAWTLSRMAERSPSSFLDDLRRMLVMGFGIALAVLLGAVALVGAPWYVAAGLAAVTLAATGAYSIAADFTGLPTLPGKGSGDGGSGGGGGPDPCVVGPYIDAGGVFRGCVSG